MPENPATKSCTGCDEEKPITEFSLHGQNWRGRRRPRCKTCQSAEFRSYYQNNREAILDRTSANQAATPADQRRARYLMRNYGLTPTDVEDLLDGQDGRCAICRGTDPRASNWHIDHDHETDRVRGVLCGPCNRALGYLGDDPLVVAAALAYLEEGR